jgi:hypothetical protein
VSRGWWAPEEGRPPVEVDGGVAVEEETDRDQRAGAWDDGTSA